MCEVLAERQSMKNGVVQLLAFDQKSEVELDAPGTASTAATVSASDEDPALLLLAQSARCIGRLQKDVPVLFPDLCNLPDPKVNRDIVSTVVVIELP